MMMPIVTRRLLIVWLAFILLSLGTVAFSHRGYFMPAISYQSVDASGNHYHYIDARTGISSISSMAIHAVRPQLETALDTNQQTLQIVRGNQAPQVIAVYPLRPLYEWQFWYDEQTVLLIHIARDPLRTELSLADVSTGQITPYLTLPQFKAALASLSPDGTQLLLRENNGGTTVATQPQAHRLLDLRRGAVTTLDALIYAHWSPDSQALLVGRPATTPLQVTTEIYDIATASYRTLNLPIAQQQVTFLPEGTLDFVNAFLWSPDSQSIMVYQDSSHQLLHLAVNGQRLATYAVGQLFPRSWSPDGRYLIATGHDQDRIGAFVFDTQSGQRHQLQSPSIIMSNLVDFAWSPDSRTIASLQRTAGINQQAQLTLYTVRGTRRPLPPAPTLSTQYYVYRGSLRWF